MLVVKQGGIMTEAKRKRICGICGEEILEGEQTIGYTNPIPLEQRNVPRIAHYTRESCRKAAQLYNNMSGMYGGVGDLLT